MKYYEEIKFKGERKKLLMSKSKNKVYNIMTVDQFRGKAIHENKKHNMFKVNLVTLQIQQNISNEAQDDVKGKVNENIMA